MLKQIAIALTASLSLSGCIAAVPLMMAGGAGAGGVGMAKLMGKSDPKSAMPRASALAIGQDVTPETVKVSEITKHKHEAHWIADTPAGHYECSDDSNMKGPAFCKKV